MAYHDPSIIGFGGASAYIAPTETGKGDNKAGPQAYSIAFSSGSFVEDVSKRVDYPSYWTSEYNGNGLKVTVKKFITDHNSAVTLLDIQNTSGSAKTFDVTASSQLAKSASGNELLGQYNAPFNNTTIYPKLSGDGMTSGNGKLKRTLALSAGQTQSMKVVMGFITPEIPESAAEYDTFKSYDNNTAFKKQVQTYNAWWADNVPYIDVPDPYVKKMAYYRWWIVRFNTLDANSTNYKYPVYMEGVLGYNNSIPVSLPWQLEEGRYLRDPVYNYGTWLLAGRTAKGANFTDNPGNPQWKMDHSFQYISKAGWESYKVFGGQASFLNQVAQYGENDVRTNKERRDSNGNNLLEDQYDAWDGDTVANFYAAHQDKVDATSAEWANAQAVAQMYAYGGNADKAAAIQTMADGFRDALLNDLWDSSSKQFLNKTLDGQLNPWRDINNYYVFQQGMVPVDNPDYREALKPWSDNAQFVTTFPAYVSNLQDYNAAKAQGKNPSRNFAPAISAVTLSIFANAIKQYPTDYISTEMYKNLLYWYTWTMYVNGDSNYPDANEYFSDWNGTDMWRSWIHHNFHSTYNTRLIEDVFGLVPRTDDSIELNPMDIGWDRFAANNIRYHNRDLSVVWVKPGSPTAYEGVPEGLSIYIDGKRVATVDKLAHIVWNSRTGNVTVVSGTAGVSYSDSDTGLLQADEVSFTSGRVAEVLASAAQDANPEVIDLSHAGLNSLGFGSGSDEIKRYQTFTANSNGVLHSIYVKVKKTGGAGQSDLLAELYATQDNVPTGAPLASGTVSASAIGNDYSVVNIPLDYAGLVDSAKYAIVLSQVSPSSSRYAWAATIGATSPSQQLGKWNGSAWVDESGVGKGWLKVYAQTTNEPSREAAVTSTRYKVNDQSKTIDGVNDDSLDDFLAAVEASPGASVQVFKADRTTPATDIQNGYQLVVTAEDQATSNVYTVRTDMSTINLSSDGNANLDFGTTTGSQVKRYQTFIARTGYPNLSGIDLKLMNANARDDATVELYAVDENGFPTGPALAHGEIEKSDIVNGVITHADLVYQGLIAGKTYAIVLGQKTLSSDGNDYRWYSSASMTDPNWWQTSAQNPKVKQDGQIVTSGKYDGSSWMDESHVGTYWLKVYTSAAVYKGDLANKIAAAQSLQASAYSTVSWTALQTALEAAIDVNNNVGASQADVNAALEALQSAIDGLEPYVNPDASVIDLSHDGNADLDFGTTLGSQVKRYQTFIARAGYTELSGVDVKIMNKNALDDATVELYEVNEGGLPTGAALAHSTIAKDQIGGNATIVHADLGYKGLVAGQKYAIVLGQSTIAEDGSDYRWMASADTSNPDWWKPDAQNPQVRQDGQDLSSGKYDGSGWVDESHVGDYWLKVDTKVQAPNAPTGLTAIAGNGQVALTWNPAQQSVTYSVYRGTASGSYDPTPVATVNSPNYTATGLTNRTTYYFAVKATNEAGASSDFSSEVSATPTANLSVTYDGNGASAGSVPLDGKAYEQGDTVSVFGNTGNLEKTGYTFEGWNTAADGSGTNYGPGASFAMGAANVTLYAKWTYRSTDEHSGSGPSSTPQTDTVISTNGKITLPVGKKGELSLGDAVKVVIPADAIGKELQLTVDIVTDTQSLIASKDTLVSPVFEILKNFSENFSKEITLTFTFDPTMLKKGQKPSVFYYDESKQNWVEVGGLTNGNTITVKVNHLTKYAVFAVGQGTDGANQLNLFDDIAGHWAEANIKQAVSAGIIKGYPDGTFKPNRTVTRAEFAVMLMNVLKPQDDGAGPATFADREKIGAWAQHAVAQAVQASIIKGYEDGSFRPDAAITRPEMAVSVARALGQSSGDAAATGFADDKDIPAWARGAVAAMKESGIIEGKGANQFAPGDKTTRAEAVTVLLKVLSYKNKDK
ncbi:S-layer homology domain-containing protein [Cohnella rhizosphaerae]|uniref:S-layer homology domain-containing protein n=1 Tax=Cohnella rhizosphaerae TaxID=1457232 RepID=A0A9X4KZS0_9BACL|nr:S-layer homology domain-containing protein [Cohnella rhizosphaerae]MDG0813466.1 S-layer homology domain-containing protein [Cohnella rhizosphaerae]